MCSGIFKRYRYTTVFGGAMKVVYTPIKNYDRYLEFLYTYKSKKRAKKACKKLVKEAKQLGFIVTEQGLDYEVADHLGRHEYTLYIQPTYYKGAK